MAKSRVKTPSLLNVLTGKPTVHTCKKKLRCFRCKDNVEIGTTFVQIPKQRADTIGKKAHCLRCFGLILNQTKKELFAIEEKLQAEPVAKDIMTD